MGVTADVMARDSQASSGYWEIVRDALADLVRIMLTRCYDMDNYPTLCEHVRGLRLVCRLSIAFVKGRATAKFWIYLCGTLRVPQGPPGPMRGRPGGAAGYRGAAREVFDWVSHMIFGA